MKHSIKNQFMAMLEGLGVPDPANLVAKNAPAYFKSIGEDFKRLASIGWQTCERVQEQQEKEQNDQDVGRN